jgi:hypothetical protein
VCRVDLPPRPKQRRRRRQWANGVVQLVLVGVVA